MLGLLEMYRRGSNAQKELIRKSCDLNKVVQYLQQSFQSGATTGKDSVTLFLVSEAICKGQIPKNESEEKDYRIASDTCLGLINKYRYLDDIPLWITLCGILGDQEKHRDDLKMLYQRCTAEQSPALWANKMHLEQYVNSIIKYAPQYACGIAEQCLEYFKKSPTSAVRSIR